MLSKGLKGPGPKSGPRLTPGSGKHHGLRYRNGIPIQRLSLRGSLVANKPTISATTMLWFFITSMGDGGGLRTHNSDAKSLCQELVHETSWNLTPRISLQFMKWHLSHNHAFKPTGFWFLISWGHLPFKSQPKRGIWVLE